MARLINRGLQVVLDFAVLSIAYWLAFLLRAEFRLSQNLTNLLLFTWPYVLVLEYVVMTSLGVPRISWRYVSMREAGRIVGAMGVSAAVLTAARIGFASLDKVYDLPVIPLSVIAMNFVLGFCGLVGVRAARRMYGETQERRRRSVHGQLKRVLLIGAGQGGVIVAREIASRPDLGLHAVGFLDDDIHKIGTNIGGLTVLGNTEHLVEIATRKRVDEAIICIASATGQQIRRIAMLCSNAGLDAKIIPGVYEIVGGRINLSRIREVAIEDLLGREPVHLDEDQVTTSVRGKTVVVTGAGGSIGSELCRQVCRFGPASLVLVERFENALFHIHRELKAAFPDLRLEPHVADVGDAARMERVFAQHHPDVVFHAAAHKHVPMMEWNPGEALKNNVGGTRVVADLADRFGVAQFVMISTDKAVNPTSVMGASKRVAEIYIQALAERSATRFVTVRFGNVLGSAGSVIPLFQEQIARGGPVMVTHPDMRRYFMTIPEASQLVLQAGAMGEGGEIFILDMGEPVKIVDLARDLIRLSGFRPDEDIDIVFTGMRPGEKLFEELATDSEHADKTKHPKIFIGHVRPHEWAAVLRGIDQLTGLADTADAQGIRAALRSLVPEYTPEVVVEPRPEPRPEVHAAATRKTGPALVPSTAQAS